MNTTTTNITAAITNAAMTMVPTMMPSLAPFSSMASSSSQAPSASLAPSSWDEHYRGHEDDSNHPYPWFDIGLRFLLVVVVILLLFLRTARQRRFNSGHPQHQTTVIINGDFTMRQNGANGNSNTNVNTAVLTLEDRVALYKKTFETNGNQLKLQPKHIIVHQNTGKTSVDGNEETQDDDAVSTFVDVELGKNADDQDDHNDNGNDEEDDLEQSTHLALASARNLTQQQDDGMHNSSSSSSSSSSSTNSDITTATTKLCLDPEQQEIDTMTNTNRTTKPTISGTCVICFEQFEKDDMIVWSEDPTCHHVYHQDCMVHFLASNAERNMTGRARRTNILDVTHNPCPTCRKNYCHVQDQDIIELMVSKTTTTTPTAAVTPAATMTLEANAATTTATATENAATTAPVASRYLLTNNTN